MTKFLLGRCGRCTLGVTRRDARSAQRRLHRSIRPGRRLHSPRCGRGVECRARPPQVDAGHRGRLGKSPSRLGQDADGDMILEQLKHGITARAPQFEGEFTGIQLLNHLGGGWKLFAGTGAPEAPRVASPPTRSCLTWTAATSYTPPESPPR